MPTVRLLQFSDTHLSGDAAARVRGVACLPALQAAVADAQRRFASPDALLLTGDLVQDDPDGYRWIRHVFASSRGPVLCLAGNHDLPDHMNAELSGAPFQIGGDHQFGRWLVIMLHTWMNHSAAGRLGTEQLASLRATLAAHRNLHVLICLHHHPIPMRSHWLDRVGLEDSAELLNIVRQNINVRGVLWGHVHQSLDTFIHGVRFMASPATCAQFLPTSADFAIDHRPPGYRTLELNADGSIASEVVWLESYAERIVA